MLQPSGLVNVLPLAPKSLASPHPYDPSYQVEVQLDEPLWVPRAGPQEVAMEIMALCLQLDSLIFTSTHSRELEGDESDGGRGGGRTVTFERAFISRASGLMRQMREHLRRTGLDDDIESYLRESGISFLFPRVELFIQEPEQDLDRIASPIMEGYFSHLTSLNNLLTMAQQLSTDAQHCVSHKYIAHQTALLYQCIGHLGPSLSQYKKELESQFTAVKAVCTPQPSGHPPRLTPELQKWLVEVTQRLVGEAVSLRPELLSPLKDILITIQNLPSQ